jgi:hypothetical protein
MIENLPLYIVVVFIITTLVTVGIFQNAVKSGSFNSRTANFLNFILPFWLILQATIATTGFYRITETNPPRLILFAILPAILVIIGLFIFSRETIEKLPLKTITLIHIIRIPVEIVLYWLFQNGQIPQVMTFEGRNFDILIGITAPFIAWLTFRNDKINKPLLIVWNLLGLILLFNIVTHAALSLPSPLQQISFEQPNRAVLYFPFIWLPSSIVPIVLFCHLAGLYKLLQSK